MNEPGTFIWNELVTSDQEGAGAFYSALFGWERHEVDAGPFGTYPEWAASACSPTPPEPSSS